MFCSTVIATIGRPTLSRSVESVLRQQLTAASHEVIVVNDSGRPLRTEEWQRCERVQVIRTKCRDKSVARNTGSAIAQGRYLHFLDDDDWLLPGALESFWQASRQASATLLYGSTQLVDREGSPLIQLHHGLGGNCFVQVMAGEWIPTGAYIVDAEAFFGIGGYNPLMPAAEDIDLCRRLALRGAFADVSALVLCAAVGHDGSTTDYDRLPTYSRKARESILDEPVAFARMRDSARGGFWRGRVVRVYATSVVWNLQHHRLLRATERATLTLAGLASASRDLFSADFWGAVSERYESVTFQRGFDAVCPEEGNAH